MRTAAWRKNYLANIPIKWHARIFDLLFKDRPVTKLPKMPRTVPTQVVPPRGNAEIAAHYAARIEVLRACFDNRGSRNPVEPTVARHPAAARSDATIRFPGAMPGATEWATARGCLDAAAARGQAKRESVNCLEQPRRLNGPAPQNAEKTSCTENAMVGSLCQTRPG